MTSLLNQITMLDMQSAMKSHLSPPSRCDSNELRDEDHDIEAVDSLSSGSSSQADSWVSSETTPTNCSAGTNSIRSRNKGRSVSPTLLHDVQTTDERLPFLSYQDSSDSEDSNGSGTNPSSSSSSSSSSGDQLFTIGAACYIQWAKLLALASILTTLLYLAPSFFLEVAYFPAHGRTFPGGLSDITSTPIFNYESTFGQPPPTVGIGSSSALTSSSDAHRFERVEIPRIVHVTYKSREELPEEWKRSLQTWEKMHPDWEVRFWSDKDIEEFVHNEFPEYEALHKSYKFVIQRVDSVRYMILHHFGGVYSDMDIYPRHSLDKLLQQWEDAGKNVLLAETYNMGVTNAFMASAPGSSFMGCVIENLPHYQHKLHHWLMWKHWEVLSTAGSTYLWGMVGHCPDDGVEILAARSFRGCSVCDAWETGKPAETCDTEWLGHSSTNSSWHEHGNWFHSFLVLFSYSFLCEPFRACFVSVTLFLVLVQRRRSRRRPLK